MGWNAHDFFWGGIYIYKYIYIYNLKDVAKRIAGATRGGRGQTFFFSFLRTAKHDSQTNDIFLIDVPPIWVMTPLELLDVYDTFLPTT